MIRDLNTISKEWIKNDINLEIMIYYTGIYKFDNGDIINIL